MKQKIRSASALLIALAFGMLTTQAQQKNENNKATNPDARNSTRDRTQRTGETNVNYSEDGHQYKMRLSGSKILDMSVDGKKVPDQEYSNYDSLVKKILTQMEKDRQQAEQDRAQATNDRAQADRDRQQALKDRAQADRDREQAVKDRAQADKDRVQAGLDREQAKKDRAQADQDRQQAQKDREQAEEDRKFVDAIVDEVVKEKLVESSRELTSLELDETRLIVNGKVQSDNLHNRFRDKYLKGKHTRISYQNSGGNKNISIN